MMIAEHQLLGMEWLENGKIEDSIETNEPMDLSYHFSLSHM